MKIKKIVNINAQVAKIVKLARADTTSPAQDDLRQGWETDKAWGDADKLWIYERNDPAGYAEIGRRVAAQVSDLPEMEVLAKLAEFRGKRLLPVNEKRKQNLLALIDTVGELIRVLPQGSRRNRCLSLFFYHRGVFFDAYEMFTEAAESQGGSAEIAQANGDKPGEAIGLFLQAVYKLKDALCQPSTDEAKAVFSIMEERYAKLIEAVRGTPLEVSWGQGNAPCHMFQACYIWLGKEHADLDKWAESVISAADSLKGVWVDIAKHYQVMNAFRKGDGLAKTELEKVAAESGDVTRKAEALLLLAREALKNEDRGKMCDLLAAMPEQGAKHIRAAFPRIF